ncbi:MAG TPA: Asp-tRNA(Asn)/Glu-tRNA(Gln) amidotransferase subunit GatA [Candidatus Saccharimonadales bacterium]|jgi:aspartyl-tRNA(Asn)/glutamyl-tRNA(Gln) amidotransferase subunit A|nr:Asp-tRNA(Asn)/Glu-tRNA(Gln) amidotransferase subunit GatA [Candidatus Saccharimonadales bacterium]
MASQWLPIAELAAKVQSGELKAAALVEQSLKTIEDKKEYDAIIVTLAESARRRAEEIDERVAKGEKIGRLAGVPFIAKDNFLVFGADTTAASNMLKGFNAPYQATAINKLEAEGAICVAKANLDAFAHGSSTENSDLFTTKNPYDKTRVPGGSSGGSAAAVALEMAVFATGTDTGSSVRLPAAFCGVVGLKPTYGLVSRSGVVAMASSLDVIGPLARTVQDAALVLDVMAGKDGLDSTMIDRQADYTNSKLDLRGVKVGILKEYMDVNVAPGVMEVLQQAIKKLRQAGVEITEVSIPSMPLSLAVYYILCPAEVSSNLSRYDGQRYPYSYPDAKDLDDSYKGSRGNGFGKEAKRRIMIGTHVLSSGYYDAYYKKAQTVRTKLIQEFNSAFEKVDFMLGAVSPTGPFKIGEKADDPLEMYLADLFMVGANLVGIPALSLPAGMDNGLPVGLQLMAPQRFDKELLGLARSAEGVLA